MMEKHLTLRTDASLTAITAVLSQIQRALSYVSTFFQKPSRNTTLPGVNSWPQLYSRGTSNTSCLTENRNHH